MLVVAAAGPTVNVTGIGILRAPRREPQRQGCVPGGPQHPPDRGLLRQAVNILLEGTMIQLLRQESAHLERLIHRLPGLNPGPYQAKWKVLSADGHIAEGVVTFTVVTSPAPQ